MVVNVKMPEDFERLSVSHSISCKGDQFYSFLKIITDTKRKKELFQLLESIRQLENYEQCFQNIIEEKYKKIPNIQFIWKVSAMLELTGVTRKIIGNLFNQHLAFLNNVFSLLMVKESLFANDDDFNRYSVITMKTLLQTVQFLPNVFQQKYEEENTKDLITNILNCVLASMVNKNFSKDCCLLAGTAMGLVFNLFANDERTVLSVMRLLGRADSCSAGNSSNKILISSLTIQVPVAISTPLFQVCLINGLTTTAHHVMKQTTSTGTLVYHEVFCILMDTSSLPDATVKYLCFQTIVNWLKFIEKLVSNQDSTEVVLFTSKDCFYMKALLEIVWNFAEDLVDGISELVQKIFSCIIKLHRRTNEGSELLTRLAQDIFCQSWKVKSRWTLLAEIIPLVGYIKVFNIHPALPEELLFCLRTSSLPAVANEVYQALLKDIRKNTQRCKDIQNSDVIVVWENLFMRTFMIAFQDNNIKLRQHMGQYFFPSTLKEFPQVFHVLDQKIVALLDLHAGSSNILHSYLLMLRNARSSGIVTTERMFELVPALTKAIHHADMDVRLEAFSLICTNPKKTESIPECCQSLVISYLQNNLNSDSSKFRQQTFSVLKKLLLNVRESSVALLKRAVKAKLSNDDAIKVSLNKLIDFVDEIVFISRSCLQPASMFQRKKTGLQLLNILTDIFIYIEDKSKRHKGAAEESAKALFEYVDDTVGKKKKMWNITAMHNELLTCMEDQHDEIRDLSLRIMVYQQGICRKEDRLNNNDLTCLYNVALSLLQSVKYHETESGATYMNLLMECSYGHTEFEYNEENSIRSMEEKSLLQILLAQARNHLKASTNDYLQASINNPVYGFSLAIAQCLKTSTVLTMELNNLHTFLNKLFVYVKENSTIMLDLLSARLSKNQASSDTVSPSFADIDEALDQIIKTCPSYRAHKEVLGHLHCRELLVSFCWLNLKSICLIITSVGELILKRRNVSLSKELLCLVMDFYQNALVRCRHKGVLEAACASLSIFAKCLSTVNESWIELRLRCYDVLRTSTDLKTHGSVTKRSAGIPMFIQAIVAAEPLSAKFELLRSCMDHLFAVAKIPLPQNVNITIDLPQFNAINILRAIIRDNTLGNNVLLFVEDSVILTIDGFSSRSWSIRNASTLLLGTLVPRMLGQRISQEENSQQSASTVEVFFHRYPKLQPFFLKCFEEQCLTMKERGANFILPHAVPVLTFLSKLRPSCNETLDRTCDLFFEYYEVLKQSSVFTIRDLVTSCIIVFTSTIEYDVLLQHTVEKILKHNLSKNSLHSEFLVVNKVLKSDSATSEMFSFMLEKVPELFNTSIDCFLSKSLFLDMYYHIALTLKTEESLTILKEVLNESFIVLQKPFTIAIGRPYLEHVVTESFVWLLTHISTEKDICYDQLKPFANCNDFLYDFFACIHKYFVDIKPSFYEHVLKLANTLIKSSSNKKLLRVTIQCSCDIISAGNTLAIGEVMELLNKSFSLCHDKNGLLPVLMPFIGSLVSILLDSNSAFSTDIIERLSKLLLQNYLPVNEEDLRMGVANTLHVTSFLSSNKEHRFTDSAIECLLLSCLALLQDEDDVIRERANLNLQFVNKLTPSILEKTAGKARNPALQVNVTLANFIHFIRVKVLKKRAYFNWLIHSLADVDHVINRSNNELILFEQESANLYAEEVVVIDLIHQTVNELIVENWDLFDVASNEKESVLNSISKLTEFVISVNVPQFVSKSIYGIFGCRRNYLAFYKLLKLLSIFSTRVDTKTYGKSLEDLLQKTQAYIPIAMYSAIAEAGIVYDSNHKR